MLALTLYIRDVSSCKQNYTTISLFCPLILLTPLLGLPNVSLARFLAVLPFQTFRFSTKDTRNFNRFLQNNLTRITNRFQQKMCKNHKLVNFVDDGSFKKKTF